MGDVRGALTGWHVTAEIPHMRNEAHSLLGIITFQLTGGYARYDKTLRRFFMTNTMYGLDFQKILLHPTSRPTQLLSVTVRL